MFQFVSIQTLFKQRSILQSLITTKVKINIIINKTSHFTSKEKQLNGKFVAWNASSIPQIKVNPEQCVSQIEIQFQFFKKEIMIGKARTFIMYGKKRIDCLDIINDKFQVIGKFTFEIIWTKTPRLLFYQQPFDHKINPFSKPTVKDIKKPQLKQEIQQSKPKQDIQNKKLNIELRKRFWNSLCCTSARHNRFQNQTFQLTFTPIQYSQEELQYAPSNIFSILPVQYYSKRFYSH